MKKKMLTFMLVFALVVSTFVGCGGSSYSGAVKNEAAAMDYAMEAPQAAPMEEEMGLSNTSSASGGSSQLPQNRKWVITVYMNAETDDLDTMTAALDAQIGKLSGYVEDQRIQNGSAYSSRRYRYASMTIRIPAADVDKFTAEVAGVANVVSVETNREDITLSYVATESRLTALETEQERLLELLAQAETMSDLLEIESRLTEVRYQLESYGSQKRLYDNQVDYATIHLEIEEVQEYTPVEEPTLWERITKGFSDSLEDLWESLQDLLVFLVEASPFLVVYGALIAIVLYVLRRCKALRVFLQKKKEARKAKKAQKINLPPEKKD